VYEASILKHSISEDGVKLVTFEINSPHAVHKDVMTHRWARNFQSFRALPPEILLAKLKAGEYFVPEVFGYRVKGMGQRNEPVNGQDVIDQHLAREIWDQHVANCIQKAERFLGLGIAKQQVNFLLQDICFIRGIITTTPRQLENFFGLRLDKDENGDPKARPEVYKIADMMKRAHAVSVHPEPVPYGGWHLPLVNNDEMSDERWGYWRKVSVGRCARVSYLTHDGIRDPDKDMELHSTLLQNGHMSPFEHQGTPQDQESSWSRYMTGSFGYGWKQYRKFIPNEANYSTRRL
jgi:hypothetical protein